MKVNLGRLDRLIRYVLGVLLTAWAIGGGPAWMYAGIYLIISASWGFCLVYAYFNLRTLKIPTSQHQLK